MGDRAWKNVEKLHSEASSHIIIGAKSYYSLGNHYFSLEARWSLTFSSEVLPQSQAWGKKKTDKVTLRMYFTRIRKCHCGFRHAIFQAWKSFEFEYNRHLNHSALETGIHNTSVRTNMVLESSSPIKKDTNHQIFAGNCRCYGGGWRLKSVLLASGMLYGISHSVILKRLFDIVFRFGTSCPVMT